ncbi:hypothetical protein KIH77_06700 [Bifidobacterium sp. 82T24]|uniref:hypothetical protein n=1 Tax=Bifidobacterium pluvialisilvae TaxID=2834436 RepID=UPI001C5A3604|nr:hypothetical protein [Bifidobacterium pluvialisilvae]MBW3088417.1 hypothetical protein [Bifidobacterium pluvialisilvae]
MSDDLAARCRDTLRRCIDETQRADRHILFGLTTALELHMVPVPEECSLDTTKLHSVASIRGRRMNSTTMVAHVWAEFDGNAQVQLTPTVYTLDLMHTWAQMARFVDLARFVALTDAIVLRMMMDGHDDPLRRLHDFLERSSSFAGKLFCRMALQLARMDVRSPQETMCRLVLVRHGVPCPETNYVVPGMTFRSGAEMTLDMAWPSARVAVEYDGDHHRTDKRQWRRDREKRERLRLDGWIVFVVTADALRDDDSRALFAFRVARLLVGHGVPVDFHVAAQPLRKLCRIPRKTRR